MAKKKMTKKDAKCCTSFTDSCKGGCGYFLGFVGAAVYYVSTSIGFWNGVWGVVKALVWPAFLVFEALKFLGA